VVATQGAGGRATACPICAQEHTEFQLIAHLNDAHHVDFLGLAEKMPVTDAEWTRIEKMSGGSDQGQTGVRPGSDRGQTPDA